ncbi:MAG: glycosyltransferase family 2 protein [Acidobacteriota bacterium]
MPLLSALIPARNEEENLPGCLESVRFADEILVVVDAATTDRTASIASEFGARVLVHEYVNSAAQKNWALPQTAHRWILIVDADERVTLELQKEIRAILASEPPVAGYEIPRRNQFLGHPIRFSGWQTDRVLRLFDRDRVRYEEREVHAKVLAPGPVPILECHLTHDTCRSFSQYWEKMRRYSDWGASELARKGKRAGVRHVFFHPVARFVKTFVLEQGFRDGMPGLVLCMLTAFTVYLKYAKLWELNVRSDRARPAPPAAPPAR